MRLCRDNLTPIGFNIADGNYHKLRYDWHNDRVEFYIDGVLKRINTNTAKGNTIPNIPGHFTFAYHDWETTLYEIKAGGFTNKYKFYRVYSKTMF